MPTKDEQKKFAFAIDSLVANTDYNYIEAIVEYCKQTGLEIEMASKLINKTLKKKIEIDAMDNNMLKVKSSSKLPI
jgi:putative aminopeptidase FrvX